MNTISLTYNMEQLKQRNPLIFTRLYHEYKDKIFTFLIIKTNGNTEIAEEVICDTFHSAIESAPKLKNSKNIKAWLFQIASRRLDDYYRKIYREKRYFNEFDDKLTYDDNFAEDIQSKQEALMLNNAFNSLKDKYKEMIRLKYIQNLSIKEISKHTGSSIATVNSLLERARLSLKKEFKKVVNEF